MTTTYFLAPSRENPPSGPIALGNIIKSPRTPEIALNNRNSETLRQLVGTAVSVVELGAQRSANGRTSFAAGIWANFLSFAGGESGFQRSHDRSDSYQFESLVSRTINPDLAVLGAIFAEPEVQGCLKDSRFRANLYMVTGVQIARGTEYIIARGRERGEHLHLSADLTPATGVPVTVGAGVDATREVGQRASGRIDDEFVFSYRLREIQYRRKVVNEQREYRKGDLHAKPGAGGREEHQVAEPEYGAEMVGLLPEDPGLPEVWDLETDIVIGDHGEEHQCVLVQGDDEE